MSHRDDEIGGRPRGIRRSMIVFLSLLCGVGIVSREASTDEELARFLVKAGRTALESGKTDEAITKFRKATVEDGNAPDAWAWLGQALEKKADKSGAIAAYRSGTAALSARQRLGATPPELRDTMKRAAARLEALAPGETELRRIQETQLADLLALARSSGEKDPATARKCVEAAIAIAPEDPAVHALAESMGIVAHGSGVAESEKPKDGKGNAKISKWDDLIARKAIESPHATYDKSSLTYEIRDGGEDVWANPNPEVEIRMVLDLEMRTLERTANNSHGGWSFGRSGEHYFAVILLAYEVSLVEVIDGKSKYLENVKVAEPGGKNPWRHLVVSIEGARRVTAAVDGKTLITHTMAEDIESGGGIGVWTQKGKVEYRTLKVGVP